MIEPDRRVEGDLLVGAYFASVSLVFWLRSLQIARSRGVIPSGRGYLVALAAGLVIGGAFIAADMISAGRL